MIKLLASDRTSVPTRLAIAHAVPVRISENPLSAVRERYFFSKKARTKIAIKKQLFSVPLL